MRGIISAAGYVPFRRLDRGRHRQDVRLGRRQGHPLGRLLRRGHHHAWPSRPPGSPGARRPKAPTIDALWFSTANPAYLDKNNASAIHAALRLDSQVRRARLRRRAALGRRRAAHGARRQRLPCSWSSSDIRSGLPTSADESQGGDGAAAVLVGSDADGPVIAEYLGAATATEEFIERWRAPGLDRSLEGVGRALRRGEVRAARRAGVERAR